MIRPTAPRVMNGKYGMLYLNGEPLYEVDSFDAKVKIDREDIEFAGEMGKDSKMVGYTGEFSFKIKKVYSRGQKLLADSIKNGIDVRSQLIGKVDDPDAFGSERVVLSNCWFNELSLMKFEIGKKIDEEFTGGFTDYDFPDLVTV